MRSEALDEDDKEEKGKDEGRVNKTKEADVFFGSRSEHCSSAQHPAEEPEPDSLRWQAPQGGTREAHLNFSQQVEHSEIPFRV